jgi:hypothetical protein
MAIWSKVSTKMLMRTDDTELFTASPPSVEKTYIQYEVFKHNFHQFNNGYHL